MCVALQVVCDVRLKNFSSVLAIGERRAMGLYDVHGPFCGFLLGLGMGIILPNFQIWDTWFWLRLMSMCVMYVTAFWPK